MSRGPEGTSRPQSPQGSLALACPWPAPALCLSRCPWLPGHQALPVMGPPRCHPTETLAGVLGTVVLVYMRPMEWRLSSSSPCVTMLAQSRAPSAFSLSLSADKERGTVETALLLH